MGEAFDIAKRMMDAFDSGDWEGATALMTDDVIGADNSGTTMVGIEHARNINRAYGTAFRYNRKFLRVVEDGDSVAMEVLNEVHNVGPLTDFLGGPNGEELPPTGKKFTLLMSDFLTVRDGKVSYWCEYFDSGQYAEAMGLDRYSPDYIEPGRTETVAGQ